MKTETLQSILKRAFPLKPFTGEIFEAARVDVEAAIRKYLPTVDADHPYAHALRIWAAEDKVKP